MSKSNSNILRLNSVNHPIEIFLFFYYTAIGVYIYAGIGITAGAHRLWAHRAYKAKLPLRALLASMQSTAFQVHFIFNFILDFKNFFLRFHHRCWQLFLNHIAMQLDMYAELIDFYFFLFFVFNF